MQLRNASTGALVAQRLFRAEGFWARGLGLLARPPLGEGEALWLDPCAGIHTWGMRYPIDVLFLSPEMRVLRVAAGVQPWRVRLAPPGTRSVVELRAGSAETAVSAGDFLQSLDPGPEGGPVRSLANQE
jgi:uncharacterized protein